MHHQDGKPYIFPQLTFLVESVACTHFCEERDYLESASPSLLICDYQRRYDWKWCFTAILNSLCNAHTCIMSSTASALDRPVPRNNNMTYIDPFYYDLRRPATSQFFEKKTVTLLLWWWVMSSVAYTWGDTTWDVLRRVTWDPPDTTDIDG